MRIPTLAFRVTRIASMLALGASVFIIVLGAVKLGAAFMAFGFVVLLANSWSVIFQTSVLRQRNAELPPRSRPTRSRLRVGGLCLAELPGVLVILLAGAEYRRALAGILERRAKKADVVLPPPPAPAVCHPPAMNERGGIICGHERIVEIHRYGGGRAAEVCTACGERLSAGENGR